MESDRQRQQCNLPADPEHNTVNKHIPAVSSFRRHFLYEVEHFESELSRKCLIMTSWKSKHKKKGKFPKTNFIINKNSVFWKHSCINVKCVGVCSVTCEDSRLQSIWAPLPVLCRCSRAAMTAPWAYSPVARSVMATPGRTGSPSCQQKHCIMGRESSILRVYNSGDKNVKFVQRGGRYKT